MAVDRQIQTEYELETVATGSRIVGYLAGISLMALAVWIGYRQGDAAVIPFVALLIGGLAVMGLTMLVTAFLRLFIHLSANLRRIEAALHGCPKGDSP